MQPTRTFRRDRKSGLWTPNHKPPLQSRINWQHPIVRDRSLVTCYLINEGGGNQVFDLTGNGDIGLLNVGSPVWVAGRNGPALSFDGTNDAVELPELIGLTDQMSVSVWINTTAFAVSTGFALATDAAVKPYQLGIQNGIGKIRVDATASGLIDFNSGDIFSSITINDGLWHNLLFTYDGTNLKLFVDGIQDGQDALTGNLQPFNTHWIGQRSDGSVKWNGLVDFPLIFNRALSVSEIAQLYREPYVFIEPLRPNRGALWEAAVVAGAVTLLTAGMGNNMGSSANLMTG